ncbi:MAG: NAD(P)H-dependent oxidoreductase [Vicinamibacterales bacterium]|jgi:FMN reductase|nr:flavoprotein [Acidobacteriota bacterium]MDP6373898.1 NAD(P)H-dependent oxidoreductase [Vicinamibacterales bacterium]MDP6609937.1 NAD(P)H-dependent oxidoreductase [Vicinamibacterales bacterium]HAK57321.1 flavoprotein [Acidobacteriota bacterium]|tara:strand:- start:10776 stop:11300 length:525 start_codon:yes stop_codon:yes gene_type:complete
MHLVVSCSLRPTSRSRILAQRAHEWLQTGGHESRFIDLVDHPLPLCDGGESYNAEHVADLDALIRQAKGVLIGTPVYNYDASAATKNLVELTGRAWTNKVVGFLCSAGGRASYMSMMGLANSLMLDFRCLVIPRFVYATKEAFEDGRVSDPDVDDRVKQLADTLASLAAAMPDA